MSTRDLQIKPQILLLYGDGGNGKTTLAKTICQARGFVHLSIDCLYVDFIRLHCPGLWFPFLNFYIAPHHDSLLIHSEWSLRQFGRDFKAEWTAFLMETLTTLNTDCVVEGYLLAHVKDRLHAELTAFDITIARMERYRPIVEKGDIRQWTDCRAAA